MIKILKNTVFGIACAMTMISISEVKADLHEDYRQIEIAIKDRDLQNENILKANPEVANEVNKCKGEFYWCLGLALGGEYSDEWRNNYIRERLTRITELEQQIGVSKMTFGELKGLLKNNEYLLSVDNAIATYMPDTKRDDCKVTVCDGSCGWFSDVDIQNNDWIVKNGEGLCSMTKGVMGVNVHPDSITICSPSGIIESKKFTQRKKSIWRKLFGKK